MKNGKKPTRSQKEIIKDWKLLPSDWLVTKHTSTEMHIQHRYSPKTRRELNFGYYDKSN